MNKKTIFTIGFTKKTAELFFSLLNEYKIKRIIDVRLSNTSQLAGFAKAADLDYFLKSICGIEYIHMPELAPTREIFNEFKKGNGTWEAYEEGFLQLLKERRIINNILNKIKDRDCFLCSEVKPDYCHRRLVAEYIGLKRKDIRIMHI